eukprot:401311_1
MAQQQELHINSEDNIQKDTTDYSPSKCGALTWNKNGLIESKWNGIYKSKAYIEEILNKKFDDRFFKENIKMLYGIFLRIQKIKPHQKNNIIANELECTVLYDIYSFTNDHIDAFYYIPV